jgi:3-deoxy-D-manno-octulosonic-acid transferase
MTAPSNPLAGEPDTPKTAGGTLLAAWRYAGLAALPALPLLLRYRAARGKEDRARLSERLGRTAVARPAGPVAWVHAASVGETNAVLPLIRKMIAARWSVLLTTVTVTSAEVAAEKLPTGAIHQFAPLDVETCVARFLDHWRPNLALFVESELWPTKVSALSSAGVPIVIVNARMSERAFRGWSRLGRSIDAVFSKIDLCLARNAADADRYAALGARRVIVSGNLKFDTPPLPADSSAVDHLRSEVGERPNWLAASTHEGEERIAGDVHRLLRQEHPDLLTMVVPRHPARGNAIRSMLAGSGLRVAQRSAGDPILPATEVYLADTLGELGIFYRLARVAFVGGSLIPHGAQNPIEPAQLGVAVLHGPHVQNWTEVYTALDEATATGPVGDAETLAAAVRDSLNDPQQARRQAAAAAEALAPFSGALDATMRALVPYLAKP